MNDFNMGEMDQNLSIVADMYGNVAARMYRNLTSGGVPGEYASQIVCTWMKAQVGLSKSGPTTPEKEDD